MKHRPRMAPMFTRHFRNYCQWTKLATCRCEWILKRPVHKYEKKNSKVIAAFFKCDLNCFENFKESNWINYSEMFRFQFVLSHFSIKLFSIFRQLLFSFLIFITKKFIACKLFTVNDRFIIQQTGHPSIRCHYLPIKNFH